MNGFVILNKEKGITSFRASSILRKIYNEKKTGHTGTLDPMASGVLPVAIGKATRFIDYLPESDKEYVARFKPGTATDTLDITGKVLSQIAVFVKRRDILGVLDFFKGDITQIPPMYSAVSVNGVRLYKLARSGVEIEREKRRVCIRELILTDYENDGEFEIYVVCSKGTYIRSLISDIGEKLGTGAVMTALTRTKSNGYSISQAKNISQLEQEKEKAVMSIDSAFTGFPEVFVTSAQSKRFSNGGELFSDRLCGASEPSLYRVYSPDGVFLGLGEITEENKNVLIAKRVIVDDK